MDESYLELDTIVNECDSSLAVIDDEVNALKDIYHYIRDEGMSKGTYQVLTQHVANESFTEMGPGKFTTYNSGTLQAFALESIFTELGGLMKKGLDGIVAFFKKIGKWIVDFFKKIFKRNKNVEDKLETLNEASEVAKEAEKEMPQEDLTKPVQSALDVLNDKYTVLMDNVVNKNVSTTIDIMRNTHPAIAEQMTVVDACLDAFNDNITVASGVSREDAQKMIVGASTTIKHILDNVREVKLVGSLIYKYDALLDTSYGRSKKEEIDAQLMGKVAKSMRVMKGNKGGPLTFNEFLTITSTIHNKFSPYANVLTDPSKGVSSDNVWNSYSTVIGEAIELINKAKLDDNTGRDELIRQLRRLIGIVSLTMNLIITGDMVNQSLVDFSNNAIKVMEAHLKELRKGVSDATNIRLATKINQVLKGLSKLG